MTIGLARRANLTQTDTVKEESNRSRGRIKMHVCRQLFPSFLIFLRVVTLEMCASCVDVYSSLTFRISRNGMARKTITRKEIRHSSPNTRVLSVRKRERINFMICVFKMEEESKIGIIMQSLLQREY